MPAVVAGAGDVMQPITVGVTRFIGCVCRVPLGTFTDRHAAPASIGTVVHRVHSPRLGDQQIVRIPESWRVHLDRTAWNHDCLILPIVAAEGIVGIIHAIAIFVIQCWQVIGRFANRIEIDRQNCRGESIFGQQGKVVGRRAHVGIATDGDIQSIGRFVQLQPVRSVVLFRTRKATHQIQLLPRVAVPSQTRNHPRVRVKIHVRAGCTRADSRIARGDVKNRILCGSLDQNSSNQPIRNARVDRTVVVMVDDALDQSDRLA